MLRAKILTTSLFWPRFSTTTIRHTSVYLFIALGEITNGGNTVAAESAFDFIDCISH